MKEMKKELLNYVLNDVESKNLHYIRNRKHLEQFGLGLLSISNIPVQD